MCIRDRFRFLGNCLPTPPLTHVSFLKSHVSEKHGLGVGWMGSYENVFPVFLFLFNILNLVLPFYWKFSGPFSLAPILLVNSRITFWERGNFECQETIAHVKHMLLSDFCMGKNDTFCMGISQTQDVRIFNNKVSFCLTCLISAKAPFIQGLH